MTTTSKEDITRLPKWARTKIHVMTMRLQEAQAREAAMFANPADTDTLFDANSDNPRPLPRGTRVRFRLDKQWLDVYVDRSEKFVAVYASAGYPTIRPWSSNVFHVEIRS